jgi:hypothetical protein
MPKLSKKQLCDRTDCLPCLQYLLTILEQMHRARQAAETDGMLFRYFGQPEGFTEARAKLVAAGYTPEQIEHSVDAADKRWRTMEERRSRHIQDR